MDRSADGFYDNFAAHYHLLWEDWEASMAWQAAAIATILRRESAAAGATVLDCACVIGTQELGLAKLGFCITGADISGGAVQRARSEAATRKLDISFHVADMRHLNNVPTAGFYVVWMDNALPHLLSETDLAQAAVQIRAKLRVGGTFVASIRDYDEILPRRPLAHGPGFFSDEGKRRIVFQIWDWQDERRYKFHMYLTCETSVGWTTVHGTSSYRAVLREEIISLMPSDPQYRSRAVRVMVRLHDEHLRRFVHTWRHASANSVTLPPTDGPAYASLGALRRNVSAAGGYMIWMCEVLDLPDPGIRSAPDAAAIVREAEDYMEHILERWRTPLREVPDDRLETPEYQSRWKTRYCIDSMLEHAVMHPVRHAFQLNELLKRSPET